MTMDDMNDEFSDEALDAALDSALAPKASEALHARILADHARVVHAEGRRRWFAEILEFFSARRYLPAGALAGLGALGFAAGVASAQVTGEEYASQDEAAYYANAAFSTAFSPNDEESLWAVD